MTAITFTLLLILISYIAGLFGALTGLGGGFILIPALVLLFHVDIHYAMGASLIAVLATSSGAAAAYLKEGYTNLRIGMFLETGAVMGALAGALAVAFLPVTVITLLFGLVLIISAYLTWKRQETTESHSTAHPWAKSLHLSENYPVQNVPAAWCVLALAGSLSGLLGIGSGTVKVVAMDQLMRLPYKVSTATSNFMIGITATASAGVYYANGYILPDLIFPMVFGVLLGALTGARVLILASIPKLRLLFSVIVLCLGAQMIYEAITGVL
jgi:uncharacterized membrane protein YfcA